MVHKIHKRNAHKKITGSKGGSQSAEILRITLPTFDKGKYGIKENAFYVLWEEAERIWRFQFAVPDLLSHPNIKTPEPDIISSGLRLPITRYYLGEEAANKASFEEGKPQPSLILDVTFDRNLKVLSRQARRGIFENVAAYDHVDWMLIHSDTSHEYHNMVRASRTFTRLLCNTYPGIRRVLNRYWGDVVEDVVQAMSIVANWQAGELMRDIGLPGMYSAHIRNITDDPTFDVHGKFFAPTPVFHEDFELSAYAVISRPLRDPVATVNSLQLVHHQLKPSNPRFSISQAGRFTGYANDILNKPDAFGALYTKYISTDSALLAGTTDDEWIMLFSMLLNEPINSKHVVDKMKQHLRNGCGNDFLTVVMLHAHENMPRAKELYALAQDRVTREPARALDCLYLADKHNAPWRFIGWRQLAVDGEKTILPIFEVTGKEQTIIGSNGKYSIKDNDSTLEAHVAQYIWSHVANLTFVLRNDKNAGYKFIPDAREIADDGALNEIMLATPQVDGCLLQITEKGSGNESSFTINCHRFSDGRRFTAYTDIGIFFGSAHQMAIKDLKSEQFQNWIEESLTSTVAPSVKKTSDKANGDNTKIENNSHINQAYRLLFEHGLSSAVEVLGYERTQSASTRTFSSRKQIKAIRGIYLFRFQDGSSLRFSTSVSLMPSEDSYLPLRKKVSRLIIQHYAAKEQEMPCAYLDGKAPPQP